VPFRETIVKAPGIQHLTKLIEDMTVLKDSSLRRGTATIASPSGDITIRMRTRPLPQSVRDFLLKYAESMNHFLLDRKARVEEDVSTERISLEKRLTLDEFKKELEAILSAEGGEWKTIIDRYYSHD
jgi:hypothetical protein